eukprot:766306-Hanusia_phi.AAC.2
MEQAHVFRPLANLPIDSIDSFFPLDASATHMNDLSHDLVWPSKSPSNTTVLACRPSPVTPRQSLAHSHLLSDGPTGGSRSAASRQSNQRVGQAYFARFELS